MENTFIHSPAQRQGEEQKQKAEGKRLGGRAGAAGTGPEPEAQTCPSAFSPAPPPRHRDTGWEWGEHPQRARLVLQNLGVSLTINPRLLGESTQRNETCCPGLSGRRSL